MGCGVGVVVDCFVVVCGCGGGVGFFCCCFEVVVFVNRVVE